MALQTTCPEHMGADNKTGRQGGNLLYNHGDEEMSLIFQLYQELFFLLFYVLFSRSTS